MDQNTVKYKNFLFENVIYYSKIFVEENFKKKKYKLNKYFILKGFSSVNHIFSISHVITKKKIYMRICIEQNQNI